MRRHRAQQLGADALHAHASWQPDGAHDHTTFVHATTAVWRALELHGVHPESGRAYRSGALHELRARAAVGVRGRLLLLRAGPSRTRKTSACSCSADVRGRPADESKSVELFVPIFERAFQEATRTLRLNLGMRDPRRELQWNRLVMHMQHDIELDALDGAGLARKLLAEHALPRPREDDRAPAAARARAAKQGRRRARSRSLVSDLAQLALEHGVARPRRVPLVPASPYERKVAACRAAWARLSVRDRPHAHERQRGRGARVELGRHGAEREAPGAAGRARSRSTTSTRGAARHAVSVAGREPGKNTARSSSV